MAESLQYLLLGVKGASIVGLLTVDVGIELAVAIPAVDPRVRGADEAH